MTIRCRATETLGTYVLGLEPLASRGSMREHLDQCDACREEWQSIRALPPLLAMAAQVQCPPS